jgi:DNA gyrase subunit A
MQYSNPRPSGIIAIALEEGDELIGVRLTDGQGDVILSTRNGQSIRFKETDVRGMGRSTYGVVGMRLDPEDEVVSLDMAAPGATLLAVSELGYGKRTHVDEYRLTRRGGKGIITMRITDKNGPVVKVRRVADDEDIMLITNGGKLIRTPVAGVSVMGRATQGVRLIDLSEGEKVVGVAPLAEKEDEDVTPPVPDQS